MATTKWPPHKRKSNERSHMKEQKKAKTTDVRKQGEQSNKLRKTQDNEKK